MKSGAEAAPGRHSPPAAFPAARKRASRPFSRMRSVPTVSSPRRSHFGRIGARKFDYPPIRRRFRGAASPLCPFAMLPAGGGIRNTVWIIKLALGDLDFRDAPHGLSPAAAGVTKPRAGGDGGKQHGAVQEQ